jgi:NLR family CARD domain-containing protein 3
MFIWDKQNHDYNTEKSERELYRYYKNLDKIVDQNNVTQHQFKSAFSEMLFHMNSLYPRKLGLIKPSGTPSSLCLKNQQLGDQYMTPLFQGAKCIPEIDQICLVNNRITENGIQEIVPHLSKALRQLDLGDNQIGRKGCDLIKEFLFATNRLQELRVYNNQLGDKNIQILIEGLISNQSI